MKETLKAIGTDVAKAGRFGIFMFATFVSVGTAWKLGNIVLDKIDELSGKKKKKESPCYD